MNVLIACEFSGVVRRAFEAKGHNAHSCDLLGAEDGCLDRHIQGDILEVLKFVKPGQWDLLIAHPPCTYLCNSGVRWLHTTYGGRSVYRNEERFKAMYEACDFFAALYHAPITRVCIENPVMHKYARDYLQSAWKVPTHSMTLQPYEHGHGETKRTALWLRGLPDLKPSCPVDGRKSRVHFASPGPDRWKERSRTLPGIAAALAQQWGSL